MRHIRLKCFFYSKDILVGSFNCPFTAQKDDAAQILTKNAKICFFQKCLKDLWQC